MTEKLADADREALSEIYEGCEALRIIDDLTERLAAAERRLAEATALLKLAKDGMYDDLENEIRAFLASQPAAPARTEAEQAVLDEMTKMRERWLRDGIALECETFYLCCAELARRGLK